MTGYVAPAYPRISDYVAWWAQKKPDADAMVLGVARISYLQFHEAVERLARALLADGVKKGDRVATLQTSHPDYFISFLATASIGAIWVGLNPRYQLEELKYVITDAEPTVLLARTYVEGRDYSEDIYALRATCSSLRTVIVFDGDPLLNEALSMQDFIDRGKTISDDQLSSARQNCGGRDPCLIVYTSGSTGKPKGALLHHEGIVTFSREQDRLWPLDPPSLINYFPINHVGCVIDCSTPCLVGGGKMVLMEHFDPAECLKLMAQEKITSWASVPTVFQMQLALPNFASFDLSSLQMIVWEGAAMPNDTIQRLLEICPRLATNYSMTETTSAITIVEPTDNIDVLANSVGKAFPGVSIRLCGPDGREVADGIEGEVQTRSALNCLGYWRRPDATAEAFTEDGYFRTGDLAIRRPDGRYRIVGRLKEMYKSGGYNVYPREIETVIEGLPSVALAAVVAVPDPLWDEVGIAYVVPKQPLTVAELEAHCRSNLANYKVPKRFVITEYLPLLPIGKVDKRALKSMAAT